VEPLNQRINDGALFIGLRPLNYRKDTIMNTQTPKAHAARINVQVKAIGSNKAKMFMAMQQATYLALEHAQLYSNSTPMLTVANAINEVGNNKLIPALNRWLAEYSPVRVNVTSQKTGMLSARAKAYRPFDLEQAELNPFYAVEEGEKPVTYFRPSKFVKLLLEGAEKQYVAAQQKDGTVLGAPDEVFATVLDKMGAVFTPAFLAELVRDEDAYIAAQADSDEA